MLTVIADDITGAAEIAGIGFRFGLRTSLLTEVKQPLPDCDILVVATDTRSLSEQEAMAETHQVLHALQEAGAHEFFKKTDSALRGHVVAELKVFLEESSYTKVLLLPENPSKGRVVRNGVYYVNDKPLHETSFAFDPEFPATTSVVTDRLPGVQLLGASSTAEALPMYIANAASEAEVVTALTSVDWNETLLAGAADLFTSYIQRRFAAVIKQREPFVTPTFSGLSSGEALIVCGSTLSTSLAEQPYIQAHAIPVSQMPKELFEGISSPSAWIDALKLRYASSHSMVLTIGYPSQGGKTFALRLRTTMSEVVAALVGQTCPKELVIEGGATAFSILKKLGWSCFLLTDEVAPGVVRMQWSGMPNVHVTLKPGSYQWGALFK